MIVVDNGSTGGGMMCMHGPIGPPPGLVRLGGNFSIVAKGQRLLSEDERLGDHVRAYRRAIITSTIREWAV